MKVAKAVKNFNLLEHFGSLMQDPSFSTARMFGSLAVYYRGLNVAVLSESPGEKSFRGKRYRFDLWDGVLFPTERSHHASLTEDFPQLQPHPVLGKWLYLVQQTEDFEETLKEILHLIRRQDPRFGILPGQKKKAKKKK